MKLSQQGFLPFYEDGFRKLIPDRLGIKYILCQLLPEVNSINIRYDIGGSDFVVTETFTDNSNMLRAFNQYDQATVIAKIAGEMVRCGSVPSDT